jgi:methyl-accepting chemotaxis protein
VTSQAKSLSDVSTKLSEAATEQAASLQETVSSVDEISAMVSKNAEGAERSAQTSGASTKAATKGKQTVENMIHSINDISASNDEIMSQMMQSNREFSEIVTVISEIGNKTKVINDIVFQTKLLSFNASVEAARAGEHGKGFAVVAEEVGNLAAMSGKAAKEISDMLGDSIKKVTSIVDNTKIKVENLVRQGKDKIQVGTLTARECGQALDEILNNVSSVNSLVNEISVASNEQAHGIQEVTKAMSQLDQVTQQNTAVANESSVMSAQLNKQAEDLTGIIQQLLMIVEGKESTVVNTHQQVQNNENNNGNVVRMPKQQKSNQGPMKKAVGQSNVPDRDDDRFEDV